MIYKLETKIFLKIGGLTFYCFLVLIVLLFQLKLVILDFRIFHSATLTIRIIGNRLNKIIGSNF